MRSVNYRLRVIVFLAALFVTAWSGQAAAQSSGWNLQPINALRTVDCNLTSTYCPGQFIRGTWLDVYNTQTTRDDSSAPLSPSRVAVAGMYYPTPICGHGTNGQTSLPCAVGGIHLAWYDNQNTNRELYVGVMFKLNPGYGCSLVGMSKIFFMRMMENINSSERRSNGVFLLRGCDTTNRTMIFSHNSSTVNNSHTCGDGGLACFQNTGHVPIANGVWYRFEACIRSSTNNTSRDGVLWWAINGTIVGTYTDFNYQGVNQFDWNQTWDSYGNGQGFNQVTEQIVDHIVVAIPTNGGCASRVGGGVPSPPAPPPPPPGPTPPPPPPVTTNPGTVTDLAATATSSTSARLTFTIQNDGNGSQAKQDIRFALAPTNWGAAQSVSSGDCSTPVVPSAAIGTTWQCDVTGLTPGTAYQFQTVSYRGTLNQGAVYGGLSNVASATTPGVPLPVVSSFNPASGLEGSSVTVVGANFGSTTGDNTVRLNGQAATVTSATVSSITFTVPSGATSGRISVQTINGTGFSEQNFTVTLPEPPVDPSGGCGCS